MSGLIGRFIATVIDHGLTLVIGHGLALGIIAPAHPGRPRPLSVVRQPLAWSMKHQRQASPGSKLRITGWPVSS